MKINYTTKGGKYKVGNYEFNNKGDIEKCIQHILSTIKQCTAIIDQNILDFLYNLLTHHPKYDSEILYYIKNKYDMVPMSLPYSNFAFYKTGNYYCRGFNTDKCIDNIKVIGTSKAAIKAKSLLKGLTDDYSSYNLFKVILNNIDKFVNNAETFDKIEGCYMIEDFYIGRSQNILIRIANHITETFKLYIRGEKSHNDEKCKGIFNILETGDKLNFKILSYNQEDEIGLIMKYSKTHNLTNISHNPYNKQNKIII